MEREIVLTSYNNKSGKNKPSDFTTRSVQPITLDKNRQYVIGLNRIINMSFTWFNVNSSLNNQKLKYSKDNGTSFTEIELPAGVWSYEDFDNYIKSLTKDNNTYPITLEFDKTIFRVEITLANNYQLDLRESNFNELIGFNKALLTSGTHVGAKVPNLSQDTDLLNIHCDLINESMVDGQETDIIYSFSTSVIQPSYSFTLEPQRVTFSPVNKSRISTIRIYITDGKRRIIDLNGQDTAFSLLLKPLN